jgi:prepilin-type processing-associated H-X9-DG protein
MANVAFLDGHVSAFVGTELGCGVGLIDREDVRWKVPDSSWAGPEDQ